MFAFDVLWDELFPSEQARIVQLLVERVDVDVDDISMHLRPEGIASVISELRQLVALAPGPSRRALHARKKRAR